MKANPRSRADVMGGKEEVVAPDAGSGSTALRILLGAQLRRLREAKDITREKAGWEIRSSPSKISRMELGRVGFKDRDVADLLTLYGVTDEEQRAEFFALVSEANTPGWWYRYSDVLSSWFQSYVGLETAASLIRTYEVQFVPGLLQTEDYARAVIVLGYVGASDEEIQRRVDLRSKRQQLLTRPGAPRLWAIIDEAVLRRPIGGREVMRAQLEHLMTVSELPNVTLQVMPFRFGGHAGAGGAFSILRFPEEDLPNVVYVEQLTGALYLDKPEDVDRYVAAMERLCIEADSPDRTAEILTEALQETESGSS